MANVAKSVELMKLNCIKLSSNCRNSPMNLKTEISPNVRQTCHSWCGPTRTFEGMFDKAIARCFMKVRWGALLAIKFLTQSNRQIKMISSSLKYKSDEVNDGLCAEIGMAVNNCVTSELKASVLRMRTHMTSHPNLLQGCRIASHLNNSKGKWGTNRSNDACSPPNRPSHFSSTSPQNFWASAPKPAWWEKTYCDLFNLCSSIEIEGPFSSFFPLVEEKSESINWNNYKSINKISNIKHRPKSPGEKA